MLFSHTEITNSIFQLKLKVSEYITVANCDVHRAVQDLFLANCDVHRAIQDLFPERYKYKICNLIVESYQFEMGIKNPRIFTFGLK